MREHFALYNRIIENTAYSNDLELFACTILLPNLASSAGNPRTLKTVESQKPLQSDIDSEFDNYVTASNVFTSRRKYAIHRTIASNHSFHSNQSRCGLANSYRISMRAQRKRSFRSFRCKQIQSFSKSFYLVSEKRKEPYSFLQLEERVCKPKRYSTVKSLFLEVSNWSVHAPRKLID